MEKTGHDCHAFLISRNAWQRLEGENGVRGHSGSTSFVEHCRNEDEAGWVRIKNEMHQVRKRKKKKKTSTPYETLWFAVEKLGIVRKGKKKPKRGGNKYTAS